MVGWLRIPPLQHMAISWLVPHMNWLHVSHFLDLQITIDDSPGCIERFLFGVVLRSIYNSLQATCSHLCSRGIPKRQPTGSRTYMAGVEACIAYNVAVWRLGIEHATP